MERIITISRVSLFGEGVGTDSEGNIYFVPRALPGDTVKVSVRSQDKKYCECDLLEVVNPSGDGSIYSLCLSIVLILSFGIGAYGCKINRDIVRQLVRKIAFLDR